MRWLFVSDYEHGWLGLAPRHVKVSDHFALLSGGRVAYVLRKSKKQEGCWRVVGHAYVQGARDGEAWNPEKLQDIVLV